MPTNIEWTGESWNPIRARALDNGMLGWHCEHASPGCQNCYAETQNMARRFNLGTDLAYKPGHRKDIEVFLDEAALAKPLGWKKGHKVFVCSMTDLFADFVPDAMIDRIFAVMALCPQHTFQVLTKRADRMREYCLSRYCSEAGSDSIADSIEDIKPNTSWEWDAPLPNVWLGVSVEDQQRADERIPDLLATPAAVRWISAEPLLGPVNIIDAMWARDGFSSIHATIDWVVCGGESGAKARPMHPDWARNLRDQCHDSDTPFFFKQWGEWAPGEIAGEHLDPNRAAKGLSLFDGRWDECWSEVDGHCDDEPDVYRIGKKRAGRLLDGIEHNGMPGQ